MMSVRLFYPDYTLVAEVFEKETGTLFNHRIYIKGIINIKGLNKLYDYWLLYKEDMFYTNCFSYSTWKQMLFCEKHKNVIFTPYLEKFVINWTLDMIGYSGYQLFNDWVYVNVPKLDGKIDRLSINYLIIGTCRLMLIKPNISNDIYERFIEIFVKQKNNTKGIFV
jgi:hypothetical protein